MSELTLPIKADQPNKNLWRKTRGRPTWPADSAADYAETAMVRNDYGLELIIIASSVSLKQRRSTYDAMANAFCWGCGLTANHGA